LLHSCWSIAFDCWNSNSSLNSSVLSSFQIIQTPFPYPWIFPSSPASSSSSPPRHAGRFLFSSPRPSPAPRRAAQPAQQNAVASLLPPAPAPLRLIGGARLSSPTLRVSRSDSPAASDTPPRDAWLPWPARRGWSPRLFKSRRTPRIPNPSSSRHPPTCAAAGTLTLAPPQSFRVVAVFPPPRSRSGAAPGGEHHTGVARRQARGP
jgi:hypothetical protein